MKVCKGVPAIDKAKSVENEIKTHTAVIEGFARHLATYPSTTDEDIELLRS